MLEHLAGDVQREVGRIDYAADEIEALAEQVGAALHYHDAAAVELQPRLEVGGHVVEQLPPGDEEQSLIAHLPLGVDADDGRRVGRVVELLLVEGDAVLVGHLALRALPDGHHAVDGLALGGGDGLVFGAAVLVLFAGLLEVALFHVHLDGPADVVGVFLDELHQLPLLQEIAVALALVVGLDVHDDVRAHAVLFALVDGVAVRALALPAVGGAGAVGLRDDGDPVGDHERAVEADAELADDVHVRALALVCAEAVLEGHGAALCYDAQILLKFLLRHADAVVGDGDGAPRLVRRDQDAEIVPRHAHLVVGEREVAQLVDGVGGVGDDLAQEDLLVRVDGVDHQVEQAFALGLELLFGHLSASS